MKTEKTTTVFNWVKKRIKFLTVAETVEESALEINNYNRYALSDVITRNFSEYSDPYYYHPTEHKEM